MPSNSRSWLATSTPPRHCASDSINRRRPGRSRWLVGSSSTSRSAPDRNAPASATRMRSPPLRCCAACSGGRWPNPSACSACCQCEGRPHRPSAKSRSSGVPRPASSRSSAPRTGPRPAISATVAEGAAPTSCATACTEGLPATTPLAGWSVRCASCKKTLLPTPLAPTKPITPWPRATFSGRAHSACPSGKLNVTSWN